jgi:hypothetical protein
MHALLHVNLIRFLDFYLMLMFLISLFVRLGQYREIGRLVISSGRWPKLLDLVKQHHMIFLTWSTLLPAFITLVLAIVQMIASREIWPSANVTLYALFGHWIVLIVLVPLALAVAAVDLYCTFVTGKFDRAMMERYFDQAEYWLASHTAHVVRIVTFGFINPRQMVAVEVRKALQQASELLQMSLWWMVTQVGLRVAFGLCLWGTWVLFET